MENKELNKINSIKNKNYEGKHSGSIRVREKKEISANYKQIVDMFNGKVKLSRLKRIIDSGKFSPKDRFMLDLLTGDKENRLTVFKKLFPDSIIQDINLKGDFSGIKLDK